MKYGIGIVPLTNHDSSQVIVRSLKGTQIYGRLTFFFYHQNCKNVGNHTIHGVICQKIFEANTRTTMDVSWNRGPNNHTNSLLGKDAPGGTKILRNSGTGYRLADVLEWTCPPEMAGRAQKGNLWRLDSEAGSGQLQIAGQKSSTKVPLYIYITYIYIYTIYNIF